MKLTVEKSSLLDALKKVNSVLEKKTTSLQLENIYIGTDPDNTDQLIIYGTDFDSSFYGTLFCKKVVEFGEMVVNGKSLFDIVKVMPGEEVLIWKEGTKAFFRSGNSEFSLYTYGTDDFPEIEKNDEVDFIQIPLKVFEKLLQGTHFSISDDQSRMNLNGVFFKVSRIENENNFEMVSTDGHRLSLVSINLLVDEDEPEISSNGVIIHKKGIQILRSMLESDAHFGYIGFKGSEYFLFKVKNNVVNIKAINENFPEYRGVIPQDFPIKVVVNRKELSSVIKRTRVMNTKNIKSVKFFLYDGKIEIASVNPDLGEAKDFISVSYDGDEFKSAYNSQFLIDALDSIDTEEVEINLIDPKGPMKIVPYYSKKEEDEGYNILYVIMPMKI